MGSAVPALEDGQWVCIFQSSSARACILSASHARACIVDVDSACRLELAWRFWTAVGSYRKDSGWQLDRISSTSIESCISWIMHANSWCQEKRGWLHTASCYRSVVSFGGPRARTRQVCVFWMSVGSNHACSIVARAHGSCMQILDVSWVKSCLCWIFDSRARACIMHADSTLDVCWIRSCIFWHARIAQMHALTVHTTCRTM